MDIKLFNNSVYIDLNNKRYLFALSKLKELIEQSDNFILDLPYDQLLALNNLGVYLDEEKLLKKKIEAYDKSEHVNAFIYKGNLYWFDKITRASLMSAINASSETFTFIFGDNEVEMTTANAKSFLEKLELYALKVFLNTQKHLRAIRNFKLPTNKQEYLDYINSIVNYNFTTGYPNKLEL